MIGKHIDLFNPEGTTISEKIIVTGGLGFIGSNFVHHLLRTGRNLKVTNVDSQGIGSNLSSVKDLSVDRRYRYVKGDLADYVFTRKVLRNAKVVVNFAAQTHVDRSIADPEPFFESNTRAVFNILRACRENQIDRFLHISTDEVYGSINNGSFDEKSPLNPSSPYSATKAAGDLIIHAWNETYQLGVIVLRSTNNFGPWQHPEKFIPKTIIRGLKGKGIPLYGGGGQVRDWIFVSDFCRAIELALEKGYPGEVYNISAGNELSNREVAEVVLKQLNNPDASLVDVEDRPAHDRRYSLNSDKARLHFNWKPLHAFDEAIALTVKWYVDHESWWKPLATEKVLSKSPWKRHW